MSYLDELVYLKCVKEGSKLRIKIISPGFHHSANCQFPKNIRVENRKYSVPLHAISFAEGPNHKFFYRVSKSYIKIENDELIIDIDKLNKNNAKTAEAVNHQYNNYLEKCDSIIRPGNILMALEKRLNIRNMLVTKQQEIGLKKSIKDFILHEMRALKDEYAMIRRFAHELRSKRTSGATSRITICSTDSFFLIKHPFPFI